MALSNHTRGHSKMLPFIFIYTLCNLVTSVVGAPVVSRDVANQRKMIGLKNNDIAKISWKKVPTHKQDTTSIVLELKRDAEDIITVEDFFTPKDVKSHKDKSREKRQVIASDGIAKDILPPSRNKRSTVAAMVSAMINLCDNHQYLCQSIKVRDRDLKTTIRLEEM